MKHEQTATDILKLVGGEKTLKVLHTVLPGFALT